MSKIALLVGSSFSAAPLFFALKRRGLDVWVCGNAKDDPCHQYADRSFYFDYSVAAELANFLKSESIDYLVPSCNDYAYMSCAAVAEQHGFAGFDRFDIAQVLHTKVSFRKFTEANGIPAPRARQLRSVDEVAAFDLAQPLLFKPDDSFSGRGMTKTSADADLSSVIEQALKVSRSGQVLVEEFVEGNLHSHTAFIEDGDIAFDTFVDEFCTVYPFQVDCSNHPTRLSAAIQDAVRAAIRRLVGALQLADGLLHTQFIADGTNVWLIECMRRCPGDLYGGLVERSTGVPYHDLVVAKYLGERYAVPPRNADLKPYSRHTISVTERVVAHSFSQNAPAKNVEVVQLKISGEVLEPAPYDKLAILFAEHHSREEMLEVAPRWASHVTIQALERA
ncbi:ATP-grasp domain-containing protein [Bradyrhizobium sp. 2TAF24]|uniref:ATP-grasp domain-containing protein n=1 Tax=Bradyrhizobium sp. 2TAF24 TaxID=3233011 RepID=UPI003F8EF928